MAASRNTPAVIEFLGVASLLDLVVDGTGVTRAKPDPEVFLLESAYVGVELEDCVVFEDAAAGVEGALAAGMRCIGIDSPQILQRVNLVIPGFANIHLVDIASIAE